MDLIIHEVVCSTQDDTSVMLSFFLGISVLFQQTSRPISRDTKA